MRDSPLSLLLLNLFFFTYLLTFISSLSDFLYQSRMKTYISEIAKGKCKCKRIITQNCILLDGLRNVKARVVFLGVLLKLPSCMTMFK